MFYYEYCGISDFSQILSTLIVLDIMSVWNTVAFSVCIYRGQTWTLILQYARNSCLRNIPTKSLQIGTSRSRQLVGGGVSCILERYWPGVVQITVAVAWLTDDDWHDHARWVELKLGTAGIADDRGERWLDRERRRSSRTECIITYWCIDDNLNILNSVVVMKSVETEWTVFSIVMIDRHDFINIINITTKLSRYPFACTVIVTLPDGAWYGGSGISVWTISSGSDGVKTARSWRPTETTATRSVVSVSDVTCWNIAIGAYSVRNGERHRDERHPSLANVFETREDQDHGHLQVNVECQWGRRACARVKYGELDKLRRPFPRVTSSRRSSTNGRRQP